MKILVVGANGKTGRLIIKQLTKRKECQVIGLIRKQNQAGSVQAAGAEPLVKDINDKSIAEDLEGMAAIIFAAAGSIGNYQQVDHHGVENMVNACEQNAVSRFVLICALGAHDPGSWGKAYENYLQAKADGEQVLKNSGLKWTIIRPGSLNDDHSSGRVTLNQVPGGMGSIARADVAKVVVACLEDDHSIGKSFELYQGNIGIKDAIKQL